MVFTTEEFLEVAIESWPEWDLNPRPLNSVQNVTGFFKKLFLKNILFDTCLTFYYKGIERKLVYR